MRVELRIDELVAPGERAADARLMVSAAERELGRLVASSRVAWPALGVPGRVAHVSAEVPAGVAPSAAGAQLARTLFTELGR